MLKSIESFVIRVESDEYGTPAITEPVDVRTISRLVLSEAGVSAFFDGVDDASIGLFKAPQT